MRETVVVIGSGYAGTGAVQTLESELDDSTDIVWISDVDHHLVLHEAHRCIRDLEVRDGITFSCEELKRPSTQFVQGQVVDLDCDDRVIHLGDGTTLAYDYVLVAVGSQTAYFGIEGLEEHSLTLKSLDDALKIHRTISDAVTAADDDDPVQVVVGGAGLSGIQAAGEIAVFRDEQDAAMDVHLVEGLDNVFPNNDPVVQAKLAKLLDQKDVNVHTGEFIAEVDEDTVYVGDAGELEYDVLLWTGGITGQDCAQEIDVRKDERSGRINTEATFRTDDERVFAIGDAALVDQPSQKSPAPPTAQAAWQAAEVAGKNIARAVHGQPLTTWTHEDKGTVISVGDEAVAHDVDYVPVQTFGGPIAEQLKKSIAARWIISISGPLSAARAWPEMCSNSRRERPCR